jgi:hypothetical protein
LTLILSAILFIKQLRQHYEIAWGFHSILD